MVYIDRYKVVLQRDGGCPVELPEQITTPADIAKGIRTVCRPDESPVMLVLLLMFDVKNRPIGLLELARGSLDAAYVDLRAVFQPLLLANAASFAIGIYHPSGDALPSSADRSLVGKLLGASKLMGIRMLDAIILGDADGFYSFRLHDASEGFFREE